MMGSVIMEVPPEIGQRFEQIARLARYKHFVRIGDRIAGCLDYLRISFDRAALTERLLAFYLFIGVADAALDSEDIELGEKILAHFAETHCVESGAASDVEIVTEVLKLCISEKACPLMSAQLAELYRDVRRERTATSIAAYIAHRKAIGTRTAELSYVLIEHLLEGNKQRARQLMMRVGAVGCLVDSLIDLDIDRQSGLLAFKRSPLHRIRLFASAAHEGSQVLFAYPGLVSLFLAALADDISDRYGASRSEPVTLCREKMAKVARAS